MGLYGFWTGAGYCPASSESVRGSSHLSCQTHVLEEGWRNPIGTGSVAKCSGVSNFCTLGLGFWGLFTGALGKLLLTELSSVRAVREEFVLKDRCKCRTFLHVLTSVLHVYMVLIHFSSSREAYCRMSLFLFFKLLMKWNVLDQSHHMSTTAALNSKSRPGNLNSSHCTSLIFPLTVSY